MNLVLGSPVGVRQAESAKDYQRKCGGPGGTEMKLGASAQARAARLGAAARVTLCGGERPDHGRAYRPQNPPGPFAYSMIRKSGHRFSEKIMLNQNARAAIDSN